MRVRLVLSLVPSLLAAALLAAPQVPAGPAGAAPPAPPGGQQGPGGGAGRAGGGQRGGGGGARGQAPQRDAQTQQATVGTGSISGMVTLGGSATPVRRAQVTLGGPSTALGAGGGRGGRSTTTNDQGRFSFAALPAGRFTLNVSKPGYVGIAYGAKKPGRQGTPIQLAEGQTLNNLKIGLPKGGVLTGVVVDEFGEPASSIQVRSYRYVLQNGQRTLTSAGQAQTDDRGIYRIFQLQPGDYLVSAVPRNSGIGDFGNQIQAELQAALQQLQAAGIAGGGRGAAAVGNLAGGGRGQQLLDRVEQLQQQVAQQPVQQAVAYAPVYYPGTVAPGQAAKIALGVGEERSAVDFQLQLVPTAKVNGRVVSPDGSSPNGAQVTLQMTGQADIPSIPGMGVSSTRVAQDATFSFQNVTPGQYTVTVRAPVRQADANTPAGQADQAQGALGPRGGRGPGGRGGPGAITQVMWASADISIDGRDIGEVSLTLQPGMTVSGRVAFDSSSSQPPAEFSGARVNLRSNDLVGAGGGMLAQVDPTGNFTITGVTPGRYGIGGSVTTGGRAGGAGGRAAGPAQVVAGWSMKSAVVNGQDAMDFPFEIKPNDSVSGLLVTFTDRTQELTGTLQDSMGRPTSDYTIILFAAEQRFWTPQSRRILSTRPSTDGTFSFRGFPAGQYRLTAVTDAEPGEWFDPAFLSQVVSASMSLNVAEGEKKTQDIRLAGQ